MTPAEHKAERDKALARAAFELAKALPNHYGSIQINLQDGRVVNLNLNESVQLQKGDAR